MGGTFVAVTRSWTTQKDGTSRPASAAAAVPAAVGLIRLAAVAFSDSGAADMVARDGTDRTPLRLMVLVLAPAAPGFSAAHDTDTRETGHQQQTVAAGCAHGLACLEQVHVHV